MANHRKPPDQRHNRFTKDVGLVVVDGTTPEVPKPESRWLKSTKDAWCEFWASDSAELVRDSHMPSLRRLFDLKDEYERHLRRARKYRAEAEKETFVTGSTKQPVLNPLFKQAEKAEEYVAKLDTRIAALEDRFGLSPKAELNLGVSFQRRQNLEAMNAQLWADEGVPDEEEDPRALPGDTAADAS